MRHVSIRDNDRKWKKFFKEMNKLGQLEIRAGYPEGGADYGGGEDENGNKEPSLLEIVAWNEYGTYNIPPRPFLNETVDKQGDVLRNAQQLYLKAVVEGKLTSKGALQKLGVNIVDAIRYTIRAGDFRANAPITIEGGWMRNKKSDKLFYVEGKHSSRPLIDSGRMRQTVNFVIKPKGGGD